MGIISRFASIIKGVVGLPSLAPAWVRRAIINPIASAMSKAGHKLIDIGDTLQSSGVDVEVPQYGRDLKKFVSMAELRDSVLNWNKAKNIPRRLMVEADLSQNYSYRIYGEAYVYNKETDEIFMQPMSFYDDVRRTPDEYGDELSDRYIRPSKDKDLQLIEFKITHVVHDPKHIY